jgi:Uma2 family endonuclease
MAAVHAPSPKRFTREEFYRLGELGFLDERTELTDGELIQMPPIGPEHVTVCGILRRFIETVLSGDLHLRDGAPLDCGDSQPKPDLAVVLGQPQDYRSAHPRTAHLVIEVSQTSLDYDRRTKSVVYARAGVEEFWIVDLAARQVQVFGRPLDGSYSESSMFSLGETVSCNSISGLQVAVAALF